MTHQKGTPYKKPPHYETVIILLVRAHPGPQIHVFVLIQRLEFKPHAHQHTVIMLPLVSKHKLIATIVRQERQRGHQSTLQRQVVRGQELNSHREY
jgi:hypothetical protein